MTAEHLLSGGRLGKDIGVEQDFYVKHRQISKVWASYCEIIVLRPLLLLMGFL